MSFVGESSKLDDPSGLRRGRSFRNVLFDAMHRLPASFFAFVLFFFLAFNALSIFSVRVSLLPARIPPDRAAPSPVMFAVKADDPSPVFSATRLPLLQNDELNGIGHSHERLSFPNRNLSSYRLIKRSKRRRHVRALIKSLPLQPHPTGRFSARMKAFFGNSSCKPRFFMTWIGSLDYFGDRDVSAIESLFYANPAGCLAIVSSSMDSDQGDRILEPFWEKGYKAMAVSPDFAYLLKNTPARHWFNRLLRGTIDPGEVALAQNLSNLLRLSLLYKFGGVYLDTDVIILRSFTGLKNVVGAQTVHNGTRKWSRLNNAVLAFDKNHPLLFKFIEEFALTFNGNKWGHNGPYLVSRVVSRVYERPGFNFTVLPPSAFYPVDWSRVMSLFQGPRGRQHSKWLANKHRHITSDSYAVHLWNRQSRNIKIEPGSIVARIISEHCIFCNKLDIGL